jgi:ubiquinone/menaquinone biosynthesis C-methylase UbiE
MKKFSLVVGCGYTSQRDLCRCDEVFALDVDKEKILIAQKKDRNVHYAVCDARFLPLRSNCFEDVICTETLEHIINYEKVLFNILELKPGFIYLTYPTETREKLLVKISRVYAEQTWGKVHVEIVDTEKVVKLLQNYGYFVEVDFSSAESTLRRIFLQKTLEILHISYSIPDLGFITIQNEKFIHKLLIFSFSIVSRIGKLSYYFWKVFKIQTLHDSYIIKARVKEEICSNKMERRN